uniref:Uncharacterized protein n=1 Tax=Heterorhabditis bacteriophora TaxID=37862 RepID=A0A1I7WIM5_HETBA
MSRAAGQLLKKVLMVPPEHFTVEYLQFNGQLYSYSKVVTTNKMFSLRLYMCICLRQF